jgi:hypothetical protein
MNRVARAARLHLVIWPATLLMPWAIMLSSFVINLVIFAILKSQDAGSAFTGGLASLYAVVMIIFVTAMGRQFFFALGFSLTRRTYYLATMLFAVAQALVFAVAVYLLRLLENATDGWGVNLPFFAMKGLNAGNPIGQIAVYAGPFVLLAAIGTVIGAVNSRWGGTGLFVATLILTVAVGAGAALVTYREAWTSIGSWFQDQPTVALFAGYPTLLAVGIAAGGYLIIRRAALQ